ncbi:hypothetical protein HYH03_016535 [Edaphochlamys debaryana]|uniref:Regulator of MON1-CCZ1 complex N-terminal domain-containing protein n=1 Tax=Edaphochlamys debaryana TaxID=47281 RepID=A0A836BQ72_9CHLO|nr:hypothetical protein HYH03_016535 [Edaphochlamys debaryana]|eukprot:KAG2484707.1 hypothetical protein HYH03_016535 [Edaphochlamys debaryana]
MASVGSAGAGPSSGHPHAHGSHAGLHVGPPLFHVAAVDQGLHLEPETLSYWGYDDGTATLLVVKGGLVFAYDLAPGLPPGCPDALKWTFPLADGPPVRALRLSLDGHILACQRSPVLLEFVDLATGNVFVQGTDKGRGEVLTFFFTELPGAEVVLVTPTGLELLEFVPRRMGLRLKERVRLPVEWAVYTHETRMVLLGTSGGGSTSGFIKAFQFVSTGLVVLPPFTAGAAAAAATLMGGGGGTAAPAGGLVANSPAAAAAVATPPARVAADCLRLIKVYGRVYCAHINRRALKLELYRFYTDTVVLQHTYELFSPHVDIAVVDSVIVLVARTAATGAGGAAASGSGTSGGGGGMVALLYDVAAPTAQPIANPLPLRIQRHRPPRPGGAATSAADGGDSDGGGPSDADEADGGGGGAAGASAGADGTSPGAAVAAAAAAAARRWEYCSPNVLIDRSGQVVYRLALNLPAIVESCSDASVLAGFLQRRRGATPPPAPAAAPAEEEPAAGGKPKSLLLSVVRNALQERLPMTAVRVIFEDLCAGYAAALDRQLALAAALAPAAPAGAAAGSLPPPAPPPPPPPGTVPPMPAYVTADELASELFRWLQEEEVVDAPYLQAALCEYMSAAVAAGIPLPPYLQELWLEVLLQQSQLPQALHLLHGQAEAMDPHLPERLLAAAAADGDVTGGAAGGGGSGGGGGLSRQLVLDALSRRALAARYDAPIATFAAAASASAAAGGGGAAGGSDAGAYVEALLAAGDVLRAARVMRRYRVAKPSVKEFLAAVGARGDRAALAAVYRVFQEEVLSTYPKYELAARKLLPAVPVA